DLSFAIDSARRAGTVLMDRYERLERIHHKSARDVVTEADHMSEDLILSAIRLHSPGDGILAEESGAHVLASGAAPTTGKGRVWVVDPLDGTVNYANGIPFFCVSIALVCGRPHRRARRGRRHRPRGRPVVRPRARDAEAERARRSGGTPPDAPRPRAGAAAATVMAGLGRWIRALPIRSPRTRPTRRRRPMRRLRPTHRSPERGRGRGTPGTSPPGPTAPRSSEPCCRAPQA